MRFLFYGSEDDFNFYITEVSKEESAAQVYGSPSVIYSEGFIFWGSSPISQNIEQAYFSSFTRKIISVQPERYFIFLQWI